MDTIIKLLELLNIDLLNIVNPRLILTLLSIGFCVKHLQIFSKVANKFIPSILILVAIIYNISLLDELTNIRLLVQTVFDSFLTSAISVALHTQGKAIYKHLMKNRSLEDIVSKSKLDELLDLLEKKGKD